MSIFEKELISGRVTYDELPDVDVKEFTEPFLESPGVVFEFRKYLLYKDVFYGEGGEENPARADGSSSSKTLQNLVEEVLSLNPHDLLLNLTILLMYQEKLILTKVRMELPAIKLTSTMDR